MNHITERNALLHYFENPNTYLDFEHQALLTFHYQYKYNDVYQKYCQNLHINANEVSAITDIPFLPISAFKHHIVKSGIWPTIETFRSSGTSHITQRSSHHVKSLDFYHHNTAKIWNHHFGQVQDYCYLALLPGYLERDGSSLISMVQHFVSLSSYAQSGFYLRDHDRLLDTLMSNQRQGVPTVLFGVSYALLDFIEKYNIAYPSLIVIETGGMKGQREELTKAALHQKLKSGFGSDKITSEYGMTELLSQAYAIANEVFEMHQRMRCIITQINDPLCIEKTGKSGIVNIIDLANIDTCSFIQTQDVGIDHGDHTFSILGRLDAADHRGCNLMINDL
jgi:hypothetical protein